MRIATLAVAFLLTAACSKTVKVEQDPRTGRTDVDYSKGGVPETWGATLNPVGGSGISGTAKGVAARDTTQITVTITGATPGATYPWHIHEGKCTDANPPIFSDPSSYPPLVAGADGTASVTASVYKKLNEGLNYIINVHASPTNLATIVACGDLND